MRDFLTGIGAILLVMGAVMGGIAFFIGIIALFSLIPGTIFFFLWNWIVVPVFAAPALTFLQAWGLWLLIGLLTGSIRKSKE